MARNLWLGIVVALTLLSSVMVVSADLPDDRLAGGFWALQSNQAFLVTYGGDVTSNISSHTGFLAEAFPSERYLFIGNSKVDTYDDSLVWGPVTVNTSDGLSLSSPDTTWYDSDNDVLYGVDRHEVVTNGYWINMYALDGADGSVIWNTTVKQYNGYYFDYASSIVGDGSYLYASMYTDGDGVKKGIGKFDASNGSFLEFNTFTWGPPSNIELHSGYLYGGSSSTSYPCVVWRVQASNLSNDECIIDNTDLNVQDNISDNIKVDGNKVYGIMPVTNGSSDDYLFKYDLSTDSVDWGVRVAEIFGGIALGEDGNTWFFGYDIWTVDDSGSATEIVTATFDSSSVGGPMIAKYTTDQVVSNASLSPSSPDFDDDLIGTCTAYSGFLGSSITADNYSYNVYVNGGLYDSGTSTSGSFTAISGENTTGGDSVTLECTAYKTGYRDSEAYNSTQITVGDPPTLPDERYAGAVWAGDGSTIHLVNYKAQRLSNLTAATGVLAEQFPSERYLFIGNSKVDTYDDSLVWGPVEIDVTNAGSCSNWSTGWVSAETTHYDSGNDLLYGLAQCGGATQYLLFYALDGSDGSILWNTTVAEYSDDTGSYWFDYASSIESDGSYLYAYMFSDTSGSIRKGIGKFDALNGSLLEFNRFGYGEATHIEVEDGWIYGNSRTINSCLVWRVQASNLSNDECSFTDTDIGTSGDYSFSLDIQGTIARGNTNTPSGTALYKHDFSSNTTYWAEEIVNSAFRAITVGEDGGTWAYGPDVYRVEDSNGTVTSYTTLGYDGDGIYGPVVAKYTTDQVVSNASLSPESPTVSDELSGLCRAFSGFSGSLISADSYSYNVYVNGALYDSGTTASSSFVAVAADVLSSGDNVTLECTATKTGYRDSEPYNSTQITVANSPPSIFDHFVLESGSDYQCTWSSTDDDNDTVSANSYDWYKNDVSLGIDNVLLGGGNATVDDELVCELNATDGTASVLSNSSVFTVNDTTAPTITNINVPTTGTVGASYSVSLTCTDDVRVASGYPKFNFDTPSGNTGNLSMTGGTNDVYSYAYTPSVNGSHENYTFYCRDGNANEDTDMSLTTTTVGSSGDSGGDSGDDSSGGGGGGGGGSVDLGGEDPDACEVSFDPEAVVLDNDNLLVEVEITNDGGSSINPAFEFVASDESPDADDFVRVTNTVDSLLPDETATFGIRYSPGVFSGGYEGEAVLLVSGASCDAVELPIGISVTNDGIGGFFGEQFDLMGLAGQSIFESEEWQSRLPILNVGLVFAVIALLVLTMLFGSVSESVSKGNVIAVFGWVLLSLFISSILTVLVTVLTRQFV